MLMSPFAVAPAVVLLGGGGTHERTLACHVKLDMTVRALLRVSELTGQRDRPRMTELASTRADDRPIDLIEYCEIGDWMTGTPGKGSMSRDQALALLRTHKATLAQRFGVLELGLFGSVARDQAEDNSDVDILVTFDGPATSKRYFGVQFYIEDLLHRRVDLVTDKALRTEFRPYVEQEIVNV